MSSRKPMKNFLKCKLKSHSKNKRKKRESLNTVRKRKLLTTLRRLRRRRDSDKSKPLNNSLSIDKLKSSWRSVINKKKSLINKLPKLKTKLLPSLKKKNAARLSSSPQLKRVDKINWTEREEKVKTKGKKKWSSQNSGSWETKNLPLPNNKKKRKKDKEEKRCPATSRNKFQRKIEKPRKTLWWTSTPHSETTLS